MSDIGLGDSANSDWFGIKTKYFLDERILVDPARGYCYRGSTKPCESNVAIHGVLLSNTWTTYPQDRYKPGKLGIIPDSPRLLECIEDESSGA